MPNIFLSPFEYIQAIVTGSYLYFNPTYNSNGGWGEPFYTGEPPTAVNPPFGTTLTSTATQDDRHKRAAYDDVSQTLTQKFGEQFTESSVLQFPGNKVWRGDDGRVLSWWGTPGYGDWSHRCSEGFIDVTGGSPPVTVDHVGINTGDIRHYWDGSTFDYDVTLFTTNRPGLTPVKLSTLTNFVYLDGVKHTIPAGYLHDASGYGTNLMGCGMHGDWLLYSESNNTNTSGVQTVYHNAYNLVTSEYRLLKSQTRTYYSGSLPHNNQMPIIYKGDGLQAIAPRYGSGNYFYTNVNISLDGNGDPVSASLANNFSSTSFFWYGYKDGVINNYMYGRSTRPLQLYIFDGDAQNECSVGLVYDGINLSYPHNYIQLFIAIKGKAFLYDIDANGVIDYSAPVASYNDINTCLNTENLRDVWNVPTSSTSVYLDGIGLLLSLPWFIDVHNYEYRVDYDEGYKRMNVVFDDSGNGTDLASLLLDNTVSGNLLTVDPIVLI